MNMIELQQALNLYPDASPYWDSARGQETLEDAKLYGLKAQNTNRDRCRIHGELMRKQLKEAGLSDLI